MPEPDVPLPEAYRGLDPPEVWRHFAALNAIPRPSCHEEQARSYVLSVAAAAGAGWQQDGYGNVVVRVPATVDGPGGPPVALQGHLDMVCDQLPGVVQDWASDPVRPRREGDDIYATGTTLGADNGIGASMALAVLTTTGLRHGPLELLFTVEEEIGLKGALALDPGMVQARTLLNLDTESPDEIIIGSAGARSLEVSVPLALAPPAAGSAAWEVAVSCLRGGHSGVQIHEGQANAIKVLAALLGAVRHEIDGLTLATIAGGSASNAIPRSAQATVVVPPAAAAAAEGAFARGRASLIDTWLGAEPALEIAITPATVPGESVDAAGTSSVLAMLQRLPHGVLAWSADSPGIVQTSCNLALASMAVSNPVSAGRAALNVLLSPRSFLDGDLDGVQADVGDIARSAGGTVTSSEAYPGWPPALDAPLTALTRQAYQQVYGHPPEVKVIHAGLECGIIIAKLPGTQAVSMGPRITSLHTPDEHVHAPSVASTWRVVVTLLELLGAPQT
ncbi:MAG TPA: beta-Ala-His dipeptidase [Actinomycetota bacterium]|nr:beta-Ala-His dipeptidase [Actinomycetota bacterium]